MRFTFPPAEPVGRVAMTLEGAYTIPAGRGLKAWRGPGDGLRGRPAGRGACGAARAQPRAQGDARERQGGRPQRADHEVGEKDGEEGRERNLEEARAAQREDEPAADHVAREPAQDA